MTLRIGSLCSGSGALEVGLALALGEGSVLWHCENDPNASRVLAAHFPDTPNLGDITTVDWTAVPAVDWLLAGFPCQDVSSAGLQAGLIPGTRSGVWANVALAISVLRPPFVLIENVGGLLSAKGEATVTEERQAGEQGSDSAADAGDMDGVGLDDWSDDDLRAIGVVLGDLASLGYDATWGVVRASDAGGCHPRARVFIIANPPRDEGREFDRTGLPAGWGTLGRGHAAGPGSAADTGRLSSLAGGGTVAREAEGGRALSEPERRDLGPVDLLPTPMASMNGPSQREMDEGNPKARLVTAVALLPTPRAQNANERNQALWERPLDEPQNLENALARLGPDGSSGDQMLPSAVIGVEWGKYEPAIRRWEATIRRPAPSPVEPNAKGQGRLSPRFTEWMMGLPEGWVTDVPDVSRNEQLRILGNGVVPQQAALAVSILLPIALHGWQG